MLRVLPREVVWSRCNQLQVFYAEGEKHNDGERFPNWLWLKTQPVWLLRCVLVFFFFCGCINWPLWLFYNIRFPSVRVWNISAKWNDGCGKMPLAFTVDVLAHRHIFSPLCSCWFVQDVTLSEFAQLKLSIPHRRPHMWTALGELMRTLVRLKLGEDGTFSWCLHVKSPAQNRYCVIDFVRISLALWHKTCLSNEGFSDDNGLTEIPELLELIKEYHNRLSTSLPSTVQHWKVSLYT